MTYPPQRTRYLPERTNANGIMGTSFGRTVQAVLHTYEERAHHRHLAAQADLATASEQARAALTSQALGNTLALVQQAEACTKAAPAGTGYYAQIVAAYASGTARRVADL